MTRYRALGISTGCDRGEPVQVGRAGGEQDSDAVVKPNPTPSLSGCSGPSPEEPAVEFRRLGLTELSRVVEIDRRERITVLYYQHRTQLVARHGNCHRTAEPPPNCGAVWLN